MKICKNWLKEWVDISLSDKELVDCLTMAGLEVESVEASEGEQVFELAVTPNRGDCLSVQGIAREVAAATGSKLSSPRDFKVAAIDEVEEISMLLPVHARVKERCPHYQAHFLWRVDARRPTPEWILKRLRQSGIVPVSLLVDIGNYVMLELGQPLHIFDMETFHGKMQVRFAEAGERLTVLGGREITLHQDDLLIADRCVPLALAGIIGGDYGSVNLSTETIMIESAFFEPVGIALSARRHRIATESSHRFERGVDPALQTKALARAVQLVLDLTGANTGGGRIGFREARHMPTAPPIPFRLARASKLIGMPVEPERAQAIFSRLEMSVERPQNESDPWQVTPPSRRFDLKIEEDLIEEVARLIGYDRIPERPLSGSLAGSARRTDDVSTHAPPVAAIKNLLRERGYREAITYSFIEESLYNLFFYQEKPLSLVNPVSKEMAVMRAGLWPGLVKAACHNLKRREVRVRLFETANCFMTDRNGDKEWQALAGLVLGAADEEQWGVAARPVDFFDVKGDIECLLQRCGGSRQFAFVPARHRALHPSHCAEIHCEGRSLGVLGVVHPQIAAKLDLPQDTCLFELRLDTITAAEPPQFEALSKFPAVRRDLALIVPETVTASALQQTVCGLVPEDLGVSMTLFDVYRGKGVAAGEKSIGLGLILQADSRTLTDEEIDGVIQAVLVGLRKSHAIRLRV